MNCFLSRNYKNISGAGNKAKTDIERIMLDMGFKNVGLRQSMVRNKALSFFITLTGVLKMPFSIRRGDILVLQYPLKKYFSFACKLAHKRGAKVIALVHDLGSFRRKALSVTKERRRLDNADYIIAHNEKMKKWLKDNGFKAEVGTLGIFDYLSESTAPASAATAPYSIVYAGGLSPRKNTFLYELGDHISNFRFNLYGNGFDSSQAKGMENIDYMGFVKSDELIATAKGDFGLVWDGFSIDACTGDWGEYLRYNNPHKTSLYIRCHLPVIIWKEAALADFVKQNGIGITVDSLTELNDILANLTTDEYNRMKTNTIKISQQLASGHYARTALTNAVNSIKQSSK